VKLAILAAIGKNRVIGKNGKLPWHISDDLKRFKRLTTGHAVLMGRKTYESIGRPLVNRRNVVLTHRPIPGVETYGSLDEALQALASEERVFVIGGATLYSQLIEFADELYLTMVSTDVEGDAFFPPYEHLLEKVFREGNREEHDSFTFVDYVKRKVDSPVS
jgi:dihydrofolate reductase